MTRREVYICITCIVVLEFLLRGDDSYAYFVYAHFHDFLYQPKYCNYDC